MKARLIHAQLHGGSPWERQAEDEYGRSPLLLQRKTPYYYLTIIVDNPEFLYHVSNLPTTPEDAKARFERIIQTAVEQMLYNPYIYPAELAAAFLERLEPPARPDRPGKTWYHSEDTSIRRHQ